MKLVDISK